MAKQTAKMQCFIDGLCDVYYLDDDGVPVIKHRHLRFEERVVGVKRYFAAAQAQVEINRLIRVPHGPDISPHDFVVIGAGDSLHQYQIVQVQKIPDTLPPSNDITLKQVEQLLQFGGEVDG